MVYVIVGVVVLLFGLAFAWSRTAKKQGRNQSETDALKEGADARERQNKAERDHAAGGDLADDSRFLPDSDEGRA